MSDGIAELKHGVQSCRTDPMKKHMSNKHIPTTFKEQTHKTKSEHHDLPSSVRVWLAETPSVSVTTTEYLPKSSLSGLVKVSLEL